MHIKLHEEWDQPYHGHANPLEYAILDGRSEGLPCDGALIDQRWDVRKYSPSVQFTAPYTAACMAADVGAPKRKWGFVMADKNIRIHSSVAFVLDMEADEDPAEKQLFRDAFWSAYKTKRVATEEALGPLYRCSIIVPSSDHPQEKNFVFIMATGWESLVFVDLKDDYGDHFGLIIQHLNLDRDLSQEETLLVIPFVEPRSMAASLSFRGKTWRSK